MIQPNGLKGNNFVFTNSSTIGSGTMTYQWNFGDAEQLYQPALHILILQPERLL